MCLQALSSPAVDSDLWPSNIERATTVASVHSWFLDITIDISCWVRCQIRWQLCILFVFMYHLIGAYFTTWLMSEAWQSCRNNDNIIMKVFPANAERKAVLYLNYEKALFPRITPFRWVPSLFSVEVFVFGFSGLWQVFVSKTTWNSAFFVHEFLLGCCTYYYACHFISPKETTSATLFYDF